MGQEVKELGSVLSHTVFMIDDNSGFLIFTGFGGDLGTSLLARYDV